MFQPKPKSKVRPASHEVIYTLSSAVENLDEQIASKRAEQHHTAQGADQKAAIIKALVQRNDNSADANRVHHLDGIPQSVNAAGGNVKLVIQELARKFRPFNVPPPPTPITDAEIDAAEAEAAAAEEMQAKTLEVEIEGQDYDPYIQQVVFNVPDQDAAHMQKGDFFTSHNTAMVDMEDATAAVREIQDPTAYRGRFGGRRRSPGMYAISVKRQRRLKMKKHKYRKLMRKTRNIRRRLGQI
jgi:hypothetical protein